MPDSRPVRCPSEACGAIFPVEPWRLGRNMYCPDCGVRLTARPLDVEAGLAQRSASVPAAASRCGAAIERLPFTVVVDNVRSLWNVGSIFRSADAFGVERLVLCGITGCPPRDEIAKTALGAERSVAWSYREEVGAALEEQREAGATLYALERADGAVPVDRCAWDGERIALVIGNEVAGVGAAALALRPQPVAIPMLGVKESLNVAVAFGIAAHAVSTALRRAGAALAILAGLACVAGHVDAGEPVRSTAAVDEAAQAPAGEFGRVWLRAPKTRGVKRFATRAGQLEIGDDALRFIGRKRTIEIPYGSLHTVSFGTMEGDVETAWTVLEILDGEERTLYGLRDGRKLGFGRRTPEIHERVIELVRRLGVAQYDVPPATRVYDAFDWQFTLALPEDWAVRIGELVYLGDRAPWGSMALVPGAEASDPDPDDDVFDRIRRGELPAVTLERRQAPRGSSCEGFTERARRAIVEHLAESGLGDAAFESPSEIVERPAAIDGCADLRLTARDQTGREIEMHAVTHGEVLYLVGRRDVDGSRAVFDSALASLRFAKAR